MRRGRRGSGKKKRLGEEEREKKIEKKRKKERNVIWRRVEGEDEEKRLWLM